MFFNSGELCHSQELFYPPVDFSAMYKDIFWFCITTEGYA